MREIERPHPVLYPPTLIGHITNDIGDLYASRIKKAKKIEVHFGIQLNGEPHLGTGLTVILAYAIAEHLSKKFNKPAVIKFGALENGPGQKLKHDGITYQRMLSQVANEKGIPKSEAYLSIFEKLLQKITKETRIPYQIENYTALQQHPIARATLLQILDQEPIMIQLLNPSDDRLRIRFPCPKCGLADKHAKRLKLIRYTKGKEARYVSYCPHHGEYETTITANNEDFVDVNTLVRNVMKEAKIIYESEKQKTFPLVVKGTDWMHSAILVSNALEHLGYPYYRRPERIYTPMIEDWSGAKLSKSLYVGEKTYKNLPPEFVLLANFERKFGQKGLRALLSEARS